MTWTHWLKALLLVTGCFVLRYLVERTGGDWPTPSPWRPPVIKAAGVAASAPNQTLPPERTANVSLQHGRGVSEPEDCPNLRLIEGRRKVTHDRAQYAPGRNCYASAIIQYSKYRTGSTFMSRFYQKHANIFYWFEPLNLFNSTQYVKQVLNGVLSCSATSQSMVPVHEKRRNWIHGGLCGRDSRLVHKPYCKRKDFKPEKAQADCRLASRTATKIIMLPALAMLKDYLDAGARVIFHVRDPRGTINSRRKVDYFGRIMKNRKLTHLTRDEVMKRNCRELCQEIQDDVDFLKHHRPSGVDHPSVFIARYEDFVERPLRKMDELYEFLDFSPDASVRSWAQHAAQGWPDEPEQTYGTFREDPKETSQAWRHELPLKSIKVVEEACKPVMKLFGYRLSSNTEELFNKKVSYLQPFNGSAFAFGHHVFQPYD